MHCSKHKKQRAPALLLAACCALLPALLAHADTGAAQAALAAGHINQAEHPQPRCSTDGTACARMGVDGLVRDAARTSIRIAAPPPLRNAGRQESGMPIPAQTRPEENRALP